MSDKWATWLWYFNISFVNLFPFHCVTQPRSWKPYSFLKFKFLLVLFLYYSVTTRNNTEKYLLLCARWIMMSTARATKWPPACHWCECLWPNSQKQTLWGWSKDPTFFSESCAHCLAPWPGKCESEEEPRERYASNDIIHSWVPPGTWLPGLMWQSYASNSWRMKELIPLTDPHAHLI